MTIGSRGGDAVILSGIDPRFGEQAVPRMREAAEPGDAVWLTASLSRISRHLGKLLQAVEYLPHPDRQLPAAPP